MNICPEQKLPDNLKVLGLITQNHKRFLLSRANTRKKEITNTYEKMWLVVSSLKTNSSNKGYKISEGDVVRLGTILLRVNEINFKETKVLSKTEIRSSSIHEGGAGSIKKILESDEPLVVRTSNQEDNMSQNQFTCRICLMDVVEEDDPLIAPCNCAGTMGHVHLKCLRQWLSSKITTRENKNTKSYCWKNLECELCKMNYPNKFTVDDIIYDLINIERPPNNFIIFEPLNLDRDNTRFLHVVSMLDSVNIQIGRGHESDIRLNDISVSRNHAIIRNSKHGLYIEDNKSKFGTLVKIKRPIILDSTVLSVQCGRTVLNVSLKANFNWFGCFAACHKIEIHEDLEQTENVEQENLSFRNVQTEHASHSNI